LTDEEHLLIAESVERYHKDPSSFVPLESIRRSPPMEASGLNDTGEEI
jgi:hypothetical protein